MNRSAVDLMLFGVLIGALIVAVACAVEAVAG